MAKAILHLLRLAGFALLLTLLLTLMYLMILGVPEPLTRQITSELQEENVLIQIDSISLLPHQGWVLHNLRIYSPDPDDLVPLLQADELYFFIWPDEWTSLSSTEWSVSLSGKQIHVSLGLPWEQELDKSNPFKTIDRINARMQVGPAGVTVDRAKINWGGYNLTANGKIELPSQKQPPRDGLTGTFRSRAPQVAEMLTGLMFDTSPEINLYFDVPMDSPEKMEADVSLLAEGLHRKNRRYEQVRGEFKLRNNQLQFDALIEQQTNRQLEFNGWYNLTSATAQVQADNTLSSSDLLNLLPEHIAARIAVPEIQPTGPADFTATAGPCPPGKLLEQVSVQIHNLPVTFREIEFEPLRIDLERTGSLIEVKEVQTQADGNPLSGNAEINLATGDCRFSAQGRVPTAPIGELLGGAAQDWIDRVEFTNRLAETTVKASWGRADGTFKMTSTVSGKDAVCAGIPLDTLDLTMAYSNRIFSLDPIRATRGGRNFSAAIDIDLDNNLAFFDAKSGFEPDAIAQIIAPDPPTFLTNFTFTGPLTSSAAGWIDYSGQTNHAVQGSIRAASVSYGGWTADAFQSDVEAQGNKLIFTNSTMRILEGSASGCAVFDLQFDDSSAPYYLTIDANDLNVENLIGHFSPGNDQTSTGRMYAKLDVTADAKSDFWTSADGSGTVEIRDGKLRDLPVLGGFSRLIRTTLPGFSLFSLTTFYSEFELRDGAFYSEKTEVGGTLLSAMGRGTYSPKNGLDFTVRPEPLRQTRESKEWYQFQLWAAEVLKQGTSPFFNLLEFQLKGTLDEPEWRMKALPKEAYNLFETFTPSSKE